MHLVQLPAAFLSWAPLETAMEEPRVRDPWRTVSEGGKLQGSVMKAAAQPAKENHNLANTDRSCHSCTPSPGERAEQAYFVLSGH